MRKVIAWVLYPIHFTYMITLFGIFHVFQVIAFNLFGYRAHKFVVDIMNLLFIADLYIMLCRPVFSGFNKLPKNTPLIVVSNHQSMYDISPIGWGFRKQHIKFISKKELGKNLPSVSYNLRKGGSVLIDRNSGSQSIKEILKLGKKMETLNWSVLIFPEGTRSTDGKLKTFHPAGFKTLLKAAPSALIVPMVIDGNYKLHKWGKFPLNIGLKLKFTALSPISRDGFTDEKLLEKVHQQINKALED